MRFIEIKKNILTFFLLFLCLVPILALHNTVEKRMSHPAYAKPNAGPQLNAFDCTNPSPIIEMADTTAIQVHAYYNPVLSAYTFSGSSIYSGPNLPANQISPKTVSASEIKGKLTVIGTASVIYGSYICGGTTTVDISVTGQPDDSADMDININGFADLDSSPTTVIDTLTLSLTEEFEVEYPMTTGLMITQTSSASETLTFSFTFY